MLEFIIVILPGVMSFLIYRRRHKKLPVVWWKMLAYTLFYTCFINALILGGLKIIGMQGFKLFEMSLRFKIKWIILEVVLFVLCVRIERNIRRFNLSIFKQIIKSLFPAVLFFIVTYAIFAPSSLFLENIDEFSIFYSDILPVLFPVTVFLLIFIYMSAICLADEKLLHLFTAFVFSIALCMYVQGNFLNPAFPALDGTEINWASYQKENIISICFWAFCIAACLALSFLWKEKTEKVIKYMALFLSSIQMVTLLVLLFMSRSDNYVNYGYSKEDEFAVGSKTNVIIFLIDTLQTSTMEEYLTSDAYTDHFLDDFTFFDNAVSGGASTRVALPLLLTGIEYDPMQPMEVYTEEIWEETELYRDLHNNGYDVRFYTTARYVNKLPDGVADNFTVTGDSWINDYPVFGIHLYKLVNFYLMPQFLKQYFWLSENMILGAVSSAEGGYVYDDVQFYQDFKTAGGLRPDYDKSFRLYHLEGVHKPYLMNENAERLEEGKAFVTEQQILQGNMKIVSEYIDAMKEADIYENSTIVILGDHGRHEDNSLETNPAVLLKLPHETHELMHDSAPVHFRNLAASIAETVVGDYSAYGPSMYDISEESDVERLHTVDRSIVARSSLNEIVDGSLDYSRFIIEGRADGEDYYYWDPHEINRISYRMGDVIDFAANNDYVKQIDYRLYKENGAAAASNEFSMCFALESFEKQDVKLHFKYSALYNDSQKIRIYANGNKVENIICTSENIGEDMAVTIPEDMIKDKELIIRMVFPNAVTPNQLDRDNTDMRILSVAFDSMWLECNKR